MHEVARNERALPLGLDHHTHVTRRMARRGLQAHLIAKHGFITNEHGQSSIDYGTDRIIYDRAVTIVLCLAPVSPLSLGKQIPSVRKGRHPLTVHEPRVPSDMVDVKMRTEHGVDAVHRISSGLEVVQETRL